MESIKIQKLEYLEYFLKNSYSVPQMTHFVAGVTLKDYLQKLTKYESKMQMTYEWHANTCQWYTNDIRVTGKIILNCI